MRKISQPISYYSDLNGNALDNGYIYIGEKNLNPETNPVAVYWDIQGTIPAAQPIRTMNGYPSRNGAATEIYTANDYSITAKDSQSRLVYYKGSQEIPSQEIYVADYGAVGDGVADDTAAIIAAVAAAYAQGAILKWVDDSTYLTTATIPNFHNVLHQGRAIVKRGSDLWHFFPINSSQENHLYYDVAAGNNANDGLSASQPRKTLVQAKNDLLWYNAQGMLARGYWQLYFTGSATNDSLSLGQLDLQTAYPVRLNFNSVTITHNGSTTASATIATSGGSFEIDGSLTIYTGGNCSYGVYARRGQMRVLSTATVRLDNALTAGFFADDGAYFNQDSLTSHTNNCVTGMEFNFSDGTDYSIHNTPTYGTTVGRNSTAHVRTTVTGATTCALLINHAGRVDHEAGNNWKNCAVGVITYDSAVHSISAGTSLATVCNMGTANACTIMAQYFGSSGNFVLTGGSAYKNSLVGLRNDTLSVTGTTSRTLLGALQGTTSVGIKTFPAYFFADKGKAVKIRIWGNITGTAGTHTISFYGHNGSTETVFGSRSLFTSAGEFEVEITIFAVSYNSQKWCIKGIYGGTTSVLANGTSSVDFSAASTSFRVYGQLGNAADTIAVEGMEMYLMG